VSLCIMLIVLLLRENFRDYDGLGLGLSPDLRTPLTHGSFPVRHVRIPEIFFKTDDKTPIDASTINTFADYFLLF